MIELLLGLIGAVLGSGIIQFFVTRHDSKKKESIEEKLKPIEDKFKPIETKLDKIIDEQKTSEKDALRTQLLVMMTVLPDNHEEIMTLAQRYFSVLKGDWFYSSLFAKWLKENDIEKPIWFDK